MKPRFFATKEEFRAWLRENHSVRTELLVGYYKVSTGKPSMTWPESVDQALCFGWIDGIRRSVDDESYCIRFTPRRPGSNWSTVNIRKVEALIENGLMRDAGMKAYGDREEHRSEVYGYERKALTLSREFKAIFRENEKAWEFFKAQAAYYKKTAQNWVMSAKREDTRRRRLAKLIESSAKEEKVF